MNPQTPPPRHSVRGGGVIQPNLRPFPSQDPCEPQRPATDQESARMDPPIPWEVLARLQSKSNPRTTHARASGREEAFEGILEDLLNQRIPPEAEAIERRFDHLCANRATKHRRRLRLLR